MEYGKCECSGKLVERRITYYRKFNKRLYAFENVPVGVCTECGERIFKGIILEQLEEISKNREPNKNMNVPVLQY